MTATAMPAANGTARQRRNRETAPEGHEVAVTLEDTELGKLIRNAVRLEVRRMQRALYVVAVLLAATCVALATELLLQFMAPS